MRNTSLRAVLVELIAKATPWIDNASGLHAAAGFDLADTRTGILSVDNNLWWRMQVQYHIKLRSRQALPLFLFIWNCLLCRHFLVLVILETNTLHCGQLSLKFDISILFFLGSNQGSNQSCFRYMQCHHRKIARFHRNRSGVLIFTGTGTAGVQWLIVEVLSMLDRAIYIFTPKSWRPTQTIT